MASHNKGSRIWPLGSGARPQTPDARGKTPNLSRRNFIKTGLLFLPTVASAASVVIPGPASRFNSAPRAAVDPTSFTNLKGWWKADTYSLSDMATVFDSGNEWVDQAGNGYDWKNTANYPVFRTNQINGLPAIQFSGGQAGALDTPIGILASTPGFCIIAVTKSVTDGCLVSYPDDSNSISMGDGAANVIATHTRCDSGVDVLGNTMANATSSTFSAALSAARVNVWRSDTSGTIYFYEGATARGSSGAEAGQNFSFFVIGSDGTFCVNNLTGMVAELIVYDADLSPSNLSALYTDYFQPRFAL